MKLDRFRDESATPLLPLTAMIDVLFLMIIFLVLGASFDSVVSVELPEARGGPPRDQVLRVELPASGGLMLGGRRLNDEQAVRILRSRAPRSILLLPHRELSVERLFHWYDLLGKGLDVPVAVGVRHPRGP